MQPLQPTDSGDIDDLLHSVLTPTSPPNRTQWKKLDYALKFTSNIKQSANRRRQSKISESNMENTHENSNGITKLVQFENSSNPEMKTTSEALSSSFNCVKEKNKMSKFIDSVQNIL